MQVTFQFLTFIAAVTAGGFGAENSDIAQEGLVNSVISTNNDNRNPKPLEYGSYIRIKVILYQQWRHKTRREIRKKTAVIILYPEHYDKHF